MCFYVQNSAPMAQKHRLKHSEKVFIRLCNDPNMMAECWERIWPNLPPCILCSVKLTYHHILNAHGCAQYSNILSFYFFLILTVPTAESVNAEHLEEEIDPISISDYATGPKKLSSNYSTILCLSSHAYFDNLR